MNPLRLLEELYLFLHRRTYARRLRDQRRYEHKYVVSVGNISAGGTGKTPATLLLAAELERLGIPTLAALRGYGATASKNPEGVLVSDGERLFADVRTAGDEALLLARSPGLRVAAGPKRAVLIERFGTSADCVLLDDAFQNPLVYRDHELVLIDATVPPERVRVFPAGRFRERLDALTRADTILLTRANLAGDELLKAWHEALAAHAHATIYEAEHAPRSIEPPLTAGTPAGAFCGIGNPEAFFNSLSTYGIILTERRSFPDHHFYARRDLDRLFADPPELPWITTAKDFVRIDDLLRRDENPDWRSRLHVLEMELRIRHGRGEEFLRRVLGRFVP